MVDNPPMEGEFLSIQAQDFIEEAQHPPEHRDGRHS